ncbi:peptide-methionine (S)-S-oxide reductase MsrA [Candidatus Acetothermia bacterium]|nr:peptide-methionine (S)-S-oxide reductase MsrA [Candidatus Acetothermia bacterium]MBI3459925.1 peptide-methionine (S)-S-oxide reductase MsrA [Candidatus Acetothermia bacterium]
MENKILQIATFGGGCFWCVEAVFKELKGVEKVTSGYAGGSEKNPTYRQVCDGETGHAEVAQIEFDPSVISYETLVEVFFLAHDPTTLNRQGNDVGTQYRSVIFHHTDEQKKIAEAVKSRIEKEKIYRNPIVTEIAPFANFYAAEDYHQNYYEENPQQPYCRVVIDPKVTKFRQKFKELLK